MPDPSNPDDDAGEPPMLDGLVESRDPTTGTVTGTATFRAGRLDGETRQFENGELVQVATWRAGLQEGPSQRYDKGVLVERANWHAGHLHGEVAIHDATGALTMTVPYVAGRKQGRMTLYDNGRPSATISYVNDVQQGPMESLGPAGQPLAVMSYQAGRQHGPSVFRDPDGNVVRVESWRNGKLDGEVKEFYPNGVVRSQAFYRAGKLQGERITFHPDGVTRQELTLYHDGKPLGEKTVFDHKGRETIPGEKKGLLARILGS